MTGIQPKWTILLILPLEVAHFNAKSMGQSRALQVICVDDLQKSFDSMHKEVGKR